MISPYVAQACDTGDVDLAESSLGIVLDEPTEYAIRVNVILASHTNNTKV
jgi:hypothetical protein